MPLIHTISADDSFSTPTAFDFGDINLSIFGSFSTTSVSVQRSFDGGTTWLTVAQYTAPTEQVITNVEPAALWRVGVLSGSYSDGPVSVRLGQ